MKKKNKLKAIIFATVSALLTMFIIQFFFGSDSKTNQANIDFINNYGWVVENSPQEIMFITLPQQFDGAYETYNELSKMGGFDLSPYKGRRITRYSYRLLNHKNSKHETIFLHIFLYKNEIISAYISSMEVDGQAIPINQTTEINFDF